MTQLEDTEHSPFSCLIFGHRFFTSHFPAWAELRFCDILAGETSGNLEACTTEVVINSWSHSQDVSLIGTQRREPAGLVAGRLAVGHRDFCLDGTEVEFRRQRR